MMRCSFLIYLVAVSCYERFPTCARHLSVVKPSATQAKYLDYEIGASIHFNMQTFSRTMKPGKLILKNGSI